MNTWLLPFYRAAILGLIVWLIRDQHQLQERRSADSRPAIVIDQVRAFFPAADRLEVASTPDDGWEVHDAEGRRLGFVLQTSPASDGIIGFSGPSNLLLAWGEDRRIIGLRVLSSGDTREHVRDVEGNAGFLNSFNGLTWSEAQARRDVDAVSGATLTSLAMAEGVVRRLRGEAPSFRFPKPLVLEDVQRLFPQASRLVPMAERPGLIRVLGESGNILGTLARTSPSADNVTGYQGPTEMLIGLDGEGRVIQGLGLRSSYDNQPYVRYVGEDDYFLSLFNGKTLEELAGMDLKAAEVEGVSGATMTSLAAAQGLVNAASSLVARAEPPPAFLKLKWRDAGTLLVLMFGILMSWTHLRGRRRLRWMFQAVLIGYLGFYNGDMVSQALLAGWAQHGLPWTGAPGLVCLTLAALVLPVTSGRQVYCHQICPHGAAQQWLKGIRQRGRRRGDREARELDGDCSAPRSRDRRQLLGGEEEIRGSLRRLLRGARMVMSRLPAMLLGWVLVVVMVPLPFSLVGIEPFDAYLVRVAGWATLTVAVVGLVASWFVPMAYCRYGCPTGALLNFLWAGGGSGRFTRRDVWALGFVVLALGLRMVSFWS